MKAILLPVGLLLAARPLTGLAADASAPPTADSLREELRQMQRDYEQRIQQLEERISELEARPIIETNFATTPPSASLEESQELTEVNRALDREFKPVTVARERSVLYSDDSLLGNRLNKVLEGYLDTSGSYFRAGYGIDDKGGVQVPFQAPGALSKYRLGNETEQYGELVLARNFYKPRAVTTDEARLPGATDESLFEGPITHFQARISVFSDYGTGDFDFQLPEAWAAIGNVIPQNPSTKFWAGPRFYRRYQIYINDFWFLNMSGLGGGIEDFQTPVGKIGIAWLANTSADATYASFYPRSCGTTRSRANSCSPTAGAKAPPIRAQTCPRTLCPAPMVRRSCICTPARTSWSKADSTRRRCSSAPGQATPSLPASRRSNGRTGITM